MIFLIGCSNRNQENKAISTNSNTLVANDKCFFDFIYDFMVDKDFQLSRIRIDRWYYRNYFAEKDYSLHFYQSFNRPEKEFETDLQNTKYMTIIDLKKKLTSNLKFYKENKKWSLIQLEDSDFVTDSVIDFETFLYQFSTDNTFMMNHIRFPLKYTFADPDKDYADTTQYLDSNSNLKFNFFEKSYLMYFHETPKIDGKKIMIFLRGIDNGLNSYYYFEKQEDNWFLIEESDYST